jgi:hypothetical protein
MFKNVASQKFRVFAFDSATGLPKSGDAANITGYISKDYGAVTAITDTSATEEDATNAKGYYLIDATQAETNADVILVSGKSSTSGIVVVGAPAVIETFPTTGILAPTTAGRTLDVTATGEAGIDWGNVGSPTTTLNLSGTTIKTATDLATAIDAVDNFVDTEIADIQSRLPAALVGGRMDANMGAISGDTTAADNLETAFDDTPGPVPWLGIIDQGTAQSASSTGFVLRSAAAFDDDSLIGASAMVLGATQGFWQRRIITDNALSGDTVTNDAFNTTPSGAVTYKIFATPPAPASAVAAIADAVWDEAQSGHTTTGTFGKYLDQAISGVSTGGVSAADIADAVWDEACSGHTTNGTYGKAFTGATTVGLSDKASFSLSGTQTFNNTGTWTGNIVGTLSTLTTYTGNTPQTGDAYGHLTSAMADSIPSDGTRPSPTQALYMMVQGLFEGSISGTTWTIKKVDGSTTLFTVTLNDATTPTGKTRAT